MNTNYKCKIDEEHDYPRIHYLRYQEFSGSEDKQRTVGYHLQVY
jgi:hypothetical protein